MNFHISPVTITVNVIRFFSHANSTRGLYARPERAEEWIEQRQVKKLSVPRHCTKKSTLIVDDKLMEFSIIVFISFCDILTSSDFINFSIMS